MLKRLLKAYGSMLKDSSRMVNRSFHTEVFARALSMLFEEAQKHPVSWLRKQLNDSPVMHPAIRRSTFTTETIASIPCLSVTPKASSDANTTIVYFHGGGYVVGSPRSYRAILAQLAIDNQCRVIAPDYRLAPEHPFPTPQDDCLKVTEAIAETNPQARLILAGDSAGGALAIDVALQCNQRADKNEINQTVKIDALVLLSPWVDPTASGGSMRSNQSNDFLSHSFLQSGYSALMQNHDSVNPRTCFINAGLSPLPRTLIQCGSGELFVDQITEFAERAREAGVPVSLQTYLGQFHVFQLLSPVLNDAKEAMNQIARFIQHKDETAGAA